MSNGEVLVRIREGRGSHTTPEGTLHRTGELEPFLVSTDVFNVFEFKFDVCDPETGAVVDGTLPVMDLAEKVKAAIGKTEIPTTVKPGFPKKSPVKKVAPRKES